jgi:hypothetical protein
VIPIARIEDAQVEHAAGTNSFGPLRSAQIRLSTPVRKVQVVMGPARKGAELIYADSKSRCGEVDFDYSKKEAAWRHPDRKEEILVVPLYVRPSGSGKDTLSLKVRGLVAVRWPDRF